jgi:acyl homoserine lactone synthase
MSTLVIAQENSIAAPARFFENIFRLRHETFLERLQWNIEASNGLERDYFDDLEPYHIAVQNTQDGIDGCWRALPTMGSYMLKDVFPELLQGELAPTEADVWEISRFAVRKGSASSLKGYMSGITIQMVNSFYEFAREKGIKYYVTVTTVACERMLRQLGVECWRMGEGKALQIGVERSVALWIKVDHSLHINTH